MKDTTPFKEDKKTQNSPDPTETDRTQYRMTTRYHTELARFSTWMFSGIIVSITFLLLAGLRNPHTLLLVFMYAALGCFTLAILLYPLINLWSGQALVKTELKSRLNTLLYVQQILFVVGVLAALGFAIEVSLYLFATPPANPAVQGG